MGLKATTLRVLKLVEEATGLPVHVEADATLRAPTLASVTMARGATPLHVVRYQPGAGIAPDYFICYECGFILRLHALPPDQRFDLAETEAGQLAVEGLATRQVAAGKVSAALTGQLVEFLYNGFLRQLRSMPIGLRVDDWILTEFPELASLQREAVMRQLDDNLAGLRPEVRSAMPERSLSINLTMNAAFAAFWAAKLDEPQFTLPFEASGHLEAGLTLLDLWRQIPNSPTDDRHLLNAWAAQLDVSDWYQWMPYATGS